MSDTENKRSFYLYLIAFDKEQKVWFSADELLGLLTDNKGSMIDVTDDGQYFRLVEEGLEADLDFENMEKLGEFLQFQNKDAIEKLEKDNNDN